MSIEVSEISAVIVADALRNNGLDGGAALSPGSLAKLYICAENFIGHDAEEVLWDKVSEIAAVEAREAASDRADMIELNVGKQATAGVPVTVPVQLFVETYIRQLGDLIGFDLCLRHVKACYDDDDL